MREQSHIDAMRAAIRGDLERARARRPSIFERASVAPTPAARDEPVEPVEPVDVAEPPGAAGPAEPEPVEPSAPAEPEPAVAPAPRPSLLRRLGSLLRR